MRCNLCGCERFVDMPKRPAVRCADCGSLERTRVAALHLTGADCPAQGASILHFAPERGLSRLLRPIGGANYRALDIDPTLYPDLGVERFDLCADIFGLREQSVDLIVHNHVIEHLECNYTAVLMRLVKTLKPDGLMFFSMPILPGDFSDEIIAASDQVKLARFGGSLHMRRFGAAVLQQTLGMIFDIPADYDLTARFEEAQLAEANIPLHHWRSYTGASVFRVSRKSLRL